jgi:hypothetical protein
MSRRLRAGLDQKARRLAHLPTGEPPAARRTMAVAALTRLNLRTGQDGIRSALPAGTASAPRHDSGTLRGLPERAIEPYRSHYRPGRLDSCWACSTLQAGRARAGAEAHLK